eukprot:2932871-Rhodomonas_salina.2
MAWSTFDIRAEFLLRAGNNQGRGGNRGSSPRGEDSAGHRSSITRTPNSDTAKCRMPHTLVVLQNP